jgi:ParB family transcriptional regulator, chromosome partitioning protein
MMFQIHKLRLDWELMPTALKLEVLMDELHEKRDKQLAELTGLDVAVVTRCKKLLSFPKDLQERMLFAKPEDRVKADLFIEIYPIVNDRTVKSSKRFSSSQLTNKLIEKYDKGESGIKAVTDFRKIKQSLSIARGNNQDSVVLKRFEEFVESKDRDITHLEIRTAKVHKEALTLSKNADEIAHTLKGMDVNMFVGEETLWKSLRNLYVEIRTKFVEADRRLP